VRLGAHLEALPPNMTRAAAHTHGLQRAFLEFGELCII